MLINIEQGCQEWLDYRKNCITSTDCGIIMGLNPYKDADKLLLQKVGAWPQDAYTYPMYIGKQLEPIARDLYIKLTGNTVFPSVHIHDEYKWAMSSTDGITFDGELLVEIKCGKKAFEQSMENHIPDYYMAQIQHSLWVCGAYEADYFCYWDGLYQKIPVKKDTAFVEKMIEKELEFLKKMEETRAQFECAPDLDASGFEVDFLL